MMVAGGHVRRTVDIKGKNPHCTSNQVRVPVTIGVQRGGFCENALRREAGFH